jgi:hypothetical protein
MQFMRVHHAADIIRAEYERTPGLRVSFWQAQQLWNLSGELCERALMRLIRSRFLIPSDDGTYVRRDDETPARIEQIEAVLRAM